MTGSVPDPVTLPPMLQKLHDRHGVCPPKVVGDQIYGAGKTRALVDQVSQGHTQLIALVPDYEKRTDRFAPADFTLFEDECDRPQVDRIGLALATAGQLLSLAFGQQRIEILIIQLGLLLAGPVRRIPIVQGPTPSLSNR